jgi:tetratricopeptide (TPR) repeat protein
MKILLAIILPAALLLPAVSDLAAQGARNVPVSTIPGAHREPNAGAARELTKAENRTRRGERERALEAHIKAAELDSLSSEVFEQLGVSYLSNKRPRAAYAAFVRASLLDPGSPYSYNRAGQVLLYNLGRPAGANAAFERARAIDANYAPVYYSLHIYHLTRGELEQASLLIDVASKMARTEVESALFQGAQISTLMSFGDYLKADAGFRQYLRMVPGDFRVGHAHSLLQRILGRPDEAESALRILMTGRRPIPVLLNDMGQVQRSLGRRDSARAYFERAWQNDALGGEAGYSLALEALAEGDTADALTWLARVEERTPYWYPTAVLTGRIHRAQGRSAMAERAFEAAYRLNPLSPVVSAEAGRDYAGPPRGGEGDSLLTIAETSLLAGDMAFAGHYSTRATHRRSLQASALIQSTWAKVPTGISHSVRVAQLEAAREFYEDDDTRFLALIERELGNAHTHIGNLDDARTHYEQSVDLLEADVDLAAPAAGQLILLYLETGNLEAAGKLTERMVASEDATLLRAMSRSAAASGDNAAAEEFRQRSQDAAYLPAADSEEKLN